MNKFTLCLLLFFCGCSKKSVEDSLEYKSLIVVNKKLTEEKKELENENKEISRKLKASSKFKLPKSTTYSFKISNERRHQYFLMAMSECDKILKHNVMDEKILDELSNQKLRERSYNTARENLIFKYTNAGQFKFLKAACSIKIADLFAEDKKIDSAKEWYNKAIKLTSHNSLQDYNSTAKNRLKSLGSKVVEKKLQKSPVTKSRFDNSLSPEALATIMTIHEVSKSPVKGRLFDEISFKDELIYIGRLSSLTNLNIVEAEPFQSTNEMWGLKLILTVNGRIGINKTLSQTDPTAVLKIGGQFKCFVKIFKGKNPNEILIAAPFSREEAKKISLDIKRNYKLMDAPHINSVFRNEL